MAAIPNRIVIGNDPENPIVEFDNATIIAVDSDTSVSLVGEELYINQFEATLDYYVWVPYVFKPADGESAEYGPYSGDVVSFEADTIAPATELTIAVEPVQAGSGDPSPDNVRPISGWDSVDVEAAGANLLNDAFSSSYTNEIVLTEGTYYAQAWLTQTPSLHTTNPALLIDGTWTNITPPYSGDGISITGTSFGWLWNDATQTITVSAGKTYTIRYNRNDNAMQTRRLTFSKTQLSVFSPYAGQSITIQLGQTVYGGTLDVTGGTMTIDRRYIVADGVNIKASGGYGAGGPKWLPCIVLGSANKSANDSNTIRASYLRYTGRFQNTENSIGVGNGGNVIALHIGTMQGTDGTHGYNSASELWNAVNAYLQEHPLQICYKLATPIEITLTPTQIATLVGQNNVWSDAGAIETVKFSTPGGDCDGFMSSDGYVLCTKQNYDIRLLPYGTKITYYSGENIAGVFYVKNVKRVQRSWYKISAVSAIGLLDKQYHRGGIYTGQYFQDVVTEILGSDFNYIIDGVVAVQRVYGWLPYDTKRKNLYQLLLAYGVEITLGDNGAMFFAFPESERAIPIPTDRVFQGGKVIYDEPASLVEINEHSYHYDPSVAEVQLFDNSADESVTDTMVIFDEPIYPASIYCSSGSLTISSVNTNFAVVSGSGILSGKPYVHNIRLISQTNPNAPVEKVVRVEDATLVTFINADNVLARLSEYYFNATRVEQDIKVENEKPGLLYTTQNPFGELITGYIVRMNKSVTSFARATCRFLQNYEPTGAGQAYTERVVIPLGPGASQTWTIPQAVFDKEVPVFRVVLIGKGQDGAPGTDGADGTAYSSSSKGKGGAGGLGGSGGLGGNVLIITLSSQGLTEITLSNSGNDSVLSSAYYNFSSADGAPNAFGYFDILNGQLYAYPGSAGTAGGAGGNGDYYGHNTSELSTATDGENVEYEGVTYYGGKQRPRTIVNGGAVGISSNLNIYCSGAGGGGAAVGNNGGDASPGSRNIDVNGGAGADAIAPHPADNVYGAGGNGGHGGGGGGAGGAREWWNYVYSSVIATDGGTLAPYGGPGKGGKGSTGTAGAYGCAIIYY